MTTELNCPRCSCTIDYSWENRCRHCGSRIVYCASCGRHSGLLWNSTANSPAIAAHCQFCGRAIIDTSHVFKSEIYKHYRYAFKFVSSSHVPYPMYFQGDFPFGRIRHDLGSFINDFMFEDDRKDAVPHWLSTDIGTARAYRVLFVVDDSRVESITLTHETGLEVFLIAVGLLVGAETAKFILKRTLEIIEKSINKWWERNRGNHWSPERLTDGALVDHVAVRTPYWEIAIDGRFSPQEREKLITHIGRTLLPNETIEEFVSTIEEPLLAIKTVEASRRIIKRVPEKPESS